MHTVRALVASRLLEAPELEQLWRKAQRRPHYLIGFLETMPDQLPNMATERAKVVNLQGDSPATRLLQHCFSAAGQAYIATAILVLEKPQTHEAVALLLDMLGAYFQRGKILKLNRNWQHGQMKPKLYLHCRNSKPAWLNRF